MSAEDEGHDIAPELRHYGTEGLRASAFPLWRDPSCLHRPELQVPDGAGTLCLDCGVCRVRI